MNDRSTATPQPAELRKQDFPQGFRWGCATSAYQIEGAVSAGGRGESIWDRFAATPGTIRDGSSGAVACDHFHRLREDLDLMADLGLNAYRFSIAWPRVHPEGGRQVNSRGLDFYDRLVDGLLERGIEPWATLYHWDLPQALQDQGGWASRDTVDRFGDYAQTVSRRLGDRVGNWITHNEPWCSAIMGHQQGVHAPGLRDWALAMQACHHILLSHGVAVPVLRQNSRGASVGISLSLHPQRPARDCAEDRDAAQRHDGLRNRWFLDPIFARGYPADTWALLGSRAPRMYDTDLQVIGNSIDFLGVNYYFPESIAHAPGANPVDAVPVLHDGVEATDFGWEVCPDGLVDLLRRVHADYAPARIAITESGSCYEDRVNPDGSIADPQRLSYLQRHLAAAQRAIRHGVPLEGYFVWSLLDNFEWAEGYTRRFGLTHVDFATQARRLKQSGLWWRRFLRA